MLCIKKRMAGLRQFTWYQLLLTLFFAVLTVRFLYPFFSDILTDLTGMPGRQWKQAGSFWEPGLMKGVDSFLFQFWLYGWREFTSDHPQLLQLSAAILCAMMPIGWWLFCKEIMPRKWAICVSIILALCPSFFTIYGFFISETLLMPLLGFAFWLSALCYRKRCYKLFIAAGIIWTLTMLTRYVAMPMAVVTMLVLLIRIHRPILAMALLALPVCAMLYLSAWHGYRTLGFYAPFGVPELNEILARAQTSRLHIQHNYKKSWFRSPAYEEEPLMPLSRWRIHDLKNPIYVMLHKNRGYEGWKKELKRYPMTLEWYVRQVTNNTVSLLFGSSWPEVWPAAWDKKRAQEMRTIINDYLRFIWAPLIIFVMFGSLLYRHPSHFIAYGFILITLGMLLLMTLQYTSVFEGRYRKPIEPMLMISAALIVRSVCMRKGGRYA